jgi:hypothetical protein
MVEWVGTLIAGIGVLFARIERREDRLQQRTDLLTPLLELYHLVREWERFAKVTNSKLAAWVHATTPEQRSTAARSAAEATGTQKVIIHDIATDTGFNLTPRDTVEYRDKLGLSDLIAIYASDLEDQFRHVMRWRVEQLQSLQEFVNTRTPMSSADDLADIFDWAWTGRSHHEFFEADEQDLRDFERSGEQLSELRREIASFIQTHWDPKDVTF